MAEDQLERTLIISAEVDFQGDPRPRHKWVKRGCGPTLGSFGGHLRRDVMGAVCLETGEFFILLVLLRNTEVLQVVLDILAHGGA